MSNQSSKAGWASEPWVGVLREACQRAASQKKVGLELGVSGPLVNQVLSGRYRGDIDRIRGLVQGRYMDRKVTCPVLDDIPLNQCLDHQKRAFSAVNPTRVKLARACPGCDHKQ